MKRYKCGCIALSAPSDYPIMVVKQCSEDIYVDVHTTVDEIPTPLTMTEMQRIFGLMVRLMDDGKKFREIRSLLREEDV